MIFSFDFIPFHTPYKIRMINFAPTKAKSYEISLLQLIWNDI